jgi:hypothetical protein
MLPLRLVLDTNIVVPAALKPDHYLVRSNQRHFPRFWKKTKIITSREFITLVAPHLVL